MTWQWPTRLVLTGLALLLIAAAPGPIGAWAGSLSQRKLEICHVPDGKPWLAKTLQLPHHAAVVHLAHGDSPGPCQEPQLVCEETRLSCEQAGVVVDAHLDLSARQEGMHGNGVGFEPVPPGPPVRGTKPDPAEIGRCIVDAYQSEVEAGFAYAVVQDGLIQAMGAGGRARALPDLPVETMDPDDRMTIASLSKPLTAVAVMRLIEETTVDLDDPFYPLISNEFDGIFVTADYQFLPVPGPGVETITIRNLLNHTSALTLELGCNALTELLALGLVGTPGTTFSYQNTNFCLLRKVIEHVSGMNYIDYVQTKVLDPSGINGMSCEPDVFLPTLYYNTLNQPGFLWGGYSNSCSAYGWYGSAAQLAQFMGGFRLESVLSNASTNEMLTSCDVNTYCLGWWKTPGIFGMDYFWHMGDWIACFCPDCTCPKGFNGSMARFAFDTDAVLFVNTRGGVDGNPGLLDEFTILKQCFEEAATVMD